MALFDKLKSKLGIGHTENPAEPDKKEEKAVPEAPRRTRSAGGSKAARRGSARSAEGGAAQGIGFRLAEIAAHAHARQSVREDGRSG